MQIYCDQNNKKNAPAEVGAGVGRVGYQSSVSLAELAVKLL